MYMLPTGRIRAANTYQLPLLLSIINIIRYVIIIIAAAADVPLSPRLLYYYCIILLLQCDRRAHLIDVVRSTDNCYCIDHP